jgi:simple sugar transport system ATP-binding protein
MTSPAPLIEFVDIGKTFANGTVALNGVSFTIHAGQIHAICGENGAGKSTLMKILFGLEQPTEGMLRFEGKPAILHSPRAAAAKGIGMVHQHFSLIPSLTVAENIVLGKEPTRGFLFDRQAASERVRTLSARYRLPIDPDALVSTLSVAMQQKTEILKALSDETQLLILDEPTAVLTPPETVELFDRLRDLNRAGLTILFISHKLNEVRALAERVTVLRGGKVTSDTPLEDVTDQDITRLAMGHAVARTRRDPTRQIGAATIALRNLTCLNGRQATRIHDVSLVFHAGEIVGVAGVDGSGQEGLVGALTGSMAPQKGQILLGERDIGNLSTLRRRQLGVAHLPADRFRDGSAPSLGLVDNAIAGAHRSARFSTGPWMRRKACERATAEMIQAYDVRCRSVSQPLGSLSGGNAQKLIAAREFGSNPCFLIAEEPTRGIDVRAASFIHERMLALADQGAAILLLTSDLDELLSLCDRIVVMHAGRIVARFDNHDGLTLEHLGAAMLGLEARA